MLNYYNNFKTKNYFYSKMKYIDKVIKIQSFYLLSWFKFVLNILCHLLTERG